MTQTIFCVNLFFLKNRPLADSFIESQCPSVCLSPSHAIFFEASHWPSDHMTSHLRSKVTPKSSGQKWAPKVAVKKEPQEWWSWSMGPVRHIESDIPDLLWFIGNCYRRLSRNREGSKTAIFGNIYNTMGVKCWVYATLIYFVELTHIYIKNKK